MELGLNFSAANAQAALGEARAIIEEASSSGMAFRSNDLLRALRHYFWELDAAVTMAIRLKAIRLGFDAGTCSEWEHFTSAWRDRGPSSRVLDELTILGFSWYGVDLFEIRTYSEWCRRGHLPLTTITSISSGQVRAVALEACRNNGGQSFLPDGLNRFIESSKKFVQRLLVLEDT